MSHQKIATSPVASSQIAEIGYDPGTSTMAVRFPKKDGSVSLYHYANVTQKEFDTFKGAESIGRHFGQVFKPNPDKYPFTRIDETKAEQ